MSSKNSKRLFKGKFKKKNYLDFPDMCRRNERDSHVHELELVAVSFGPFMEKREIPIQFLGRKRTNTVGQRWQALSDFLKNLFFRP